jgi:predicted PurR-regulated permease PerM
VAEQGRRPKKAPGRSREVTEEATEAASLAAEEAADAVVDAESTDRPAAKKAQAGRARKAAGTATRKARQAGTIEAEDEARRAQYAAARIAADAGDVPDDDPLLDTAIRQIEAGVTDEKPFGEAGPPIAPRSPFRIAFSAALGVAVAYVLLRAVVAVRQVLILLLISAFLAIGLNPAVEWIQRRGMSRGKAVGAVIGGVLLFFLGFALAIVPPIVEQAGDFIENLPDLIETLQENDTVERLDERFGIFEEAKRAAENIDTSQGVKAVGGVVGVGRVVLSTTFSVFTILILTLYFMSAFPAIKRGAYRLVPRSRRPRVGLLADEILNRVGGYVAGAITIGLIAGVSTAVVLLGLGVEFAIALALLVAIFDLIPLVGATIGAVVVTLVTFATSGTTKGLIVLGFYIAYQQIENFVIYPRVMKRAVDVSPAATIVAVLMGGALLGPLGALLAIPTAAAVQLIGSEVVVPRQDQA